jgi:two-component sensor histidine kinase
MLIRIVNSFAVIAVVGSALVMGLILYDFLITKQTVARQIVEQKSELVSIELDKFFMPLKQVSLTLRGHLMIPEIQTFDRKATNLFFIPIITEYTQISSVGLAERSGYELDILPDPEVGYWLNREVYVDEWGMIERWTRWKLTDSLLLVDSWENPLLTDPRERMWFSKVINKADSELYWTEPYVYNTTGNIGITASMRYSIRDDNQDFRILALDITLTDLTTFSQNLNLSIEDEVYILTGNRDMIIGLPEKYADMDMDDLHHSLLSDPYEFGNNALVQLMELNSEEMVTFNSDGARWWGKLERYLITSDQYLVVATLISEKDFSSRIDRTRNLMWVGFVFILSLSTLLLRNNKKLRSFGNELVKKNNQISAQKQHLLSEVHHRVKNNLAIMSALMELENMMIDDPVTNKVLSLIQSRILSMSAVHEILYKTDEYNRILIQEIMPGIIGYFSKKNPSITISCKNKVQPVKINVNQALTFALLMNELFHYMAKSSRITTSDADTNWEVLCNVITEGDQIFADIESNFHLDFKMRTDEIGFELIQVLLQQLEATMETDELPNGVRWRIAFQLDDKKGITSDRYTFDDE